MRLGVHHSSTWPEFSFSFKNSDDHTPIPLLADSAKQLSYGPSRSGSEIRTRREVGTLNPRFSKTA
jgi:hypothetical protein